MEQTDKRKTEKMLRQILRLVWSIGRGRHESEALVEIKKLIKKSGFDIETE